MNFIPISANPKYSVRRAGSRWALIAKWNGEEHQVNTYETRRAAMAARIL